MGVASANASDSSGSQTEMDRLTEFSVCNVKGRFSVIAPKDLLFRRIAKTNTIRAASNFSFVTIHGLKYSVFANSNQVNVTGLKRFGDLASAAEEFCEHFDVELDPASFIIDNSTVAGQLADVSRALLAEVATRSDYPDVFEENLDEVDHPDAVSVRRRHGDTAPFVCVARTRWFPSIHLRPNKQQTSQQARWDGTEPKLSSCTIFPTGRIVILGAKSLRDAHYTAMRASAYMFNEPEFSIRLWDDVYRDDDDINFAYNFVKGHVSAYVQECTRSLLASGQEQDGGRGEADCAGECWDPDHEH